MEFDDLMKEISQCRLCRDQFGHEPHPILFGNKNARIMHISQAPSLTVHNTGKPFNDASGRKLREDWYRISDSQFYNPDNFYIASIAHCYPGKNPGGGDRLPPKSCAQRWLSQEIQLVDNQIFLLVGSRAAGFFFPKRKFTELVFENQEIQGKPAYILPHPSPLNVKWFMNHPEFEESRIPFIRQAVHQALL